MAYRTRTDTRTDKKKVKTEGPEILSNDIFYFKTVIIDGVIIRVGLYAFNNNRDDNNSDKAITVIGP